MESIYCLTPHQLRKALKGNTAYVPVVTGGDIVHVRVTQKDAIEWAQSFLGIEPLGLCVAAHVRRGKAFLAASFPPAEEG